jgi:ankyrin repeat protein
LEEGAKVNWKAPNGSTALSFAKKEKQREVVKILKAHGAK